MHLQPLSVLRPFHLRPAEVMTKVSLRKFRFSRLEKMLLKLVSTYISNCAHKVLSQGLLLGHRKDNFFESSSTCLRVYIPPLFVLSTSDRVFRTYPDRKWGSACIVN